MREDRIDDYLQLVADRHRRLVIQHLRHENNGETTVGDLVERLDGGEPVSVDDRRTDRRQLAVQLYHTHLPKLADLGVVEFDAVRGTVQYRPDERIEGVLDSIHGGVAWTNP